MLRGLFGSWQSTHAAAKSLWLTCAQPVHTSWERLVQVRELSHNQFSRRTHMGTMGALVHWLYHFCTQQLPTDLEAYLPLLLSGLSTGSTGLTKATTNKI
jgi:hypothetical protein